LELTLHSYHTALRGSKYLKADGVQTLYAEMMSNPDLVLKDKTFGYVFRAAADCGGQMQASWLIQVCTVSTHYFLKLMLTSSLDRVIRPDILALELATLD